MASDRTNDPIAPWRAAAYVLLGALLLSGVGVLLRYDADPAAAHASVQALSPVLRALHYWSGALVLVGVVAFAVRAWLLGAERERRYPAWGGMLGALAVGHLAFLGGRVLTWDQHGWESYAHALLALGALGGSPASPDQARLLVVLTFHIGIALLAAVVLVLLWRRHDGRSWPAFLHRALVMPWAQRRARRTAVATALGLVLLAVFVPAPLGPEPGPERDVAKPDWPFVWLAPLEALWGAGGVWAGAAAAAALIALAPLAAGAPARTRLGLLAALASAWAALSLAGLFVAGSLR